MRGRLLHGNVGLCVIISLSVRMHGRRCGWMGVSACVGVGGKLRARSALLFIRYLAVKEKRSIKKSVVVSL